MWTVKTLISAQADHSYLLILSGRGSFISASAYFGQLRCMTVINEVGGGYHAIMADNLSG